MIEMQKGVFRSVTGQKLDRRLWLPEGEPRAVVQFVHGMAEHIDRYDAAARALASAGFAVTGHSHLGHGPKAEIKGFFADKNGWQCLIDDVHTLRTQTQAYFPGKPYFLLGHSMGSFVVRGYLLEKAEGLAGARTGFLYCSSVNKLVDLLELYDLACLDRLLHAWSATRLNADDLCFRRHLLEI